MERREGDGNREAGGPLTCGAQADRMENMPVKSLCEGYCCVQTSEPGPSTQGLRATFPNAPTSSGSSFHISQHGSHTQLSPHPSYCSLVPQCPRTPEISRKESGTLNFPYHHLPSPPHTHLQGSSSKPPSPPRRIKPTLAATQIERVES